MSIAELFRRLFGRSGSDPVPPEHPDPEPGPTPEPVPTPEPGPEPVPNPEPVRPQGLLAVTCIGESHIKAGTVCQDSSLCQQGDGWRFIAVSDGHGSSSFPRSDRGSRLACRVALEVCTQQLADGLPADREEAARVLCGDIVARWRQAVLADYADQPFTQEELEGVSDKYREHYRAGRQVEHAYGATLIAVLECKAGVLALRCGDGECVAVDLRGDMSRPIPWNDKCDVNVTVSLCDATAAEEFRWVWLDRMPAAVWIGTDGVDNSYPVPEQLDEFYANLSLRACEQGCQAVRAELEQFLPQLTRRCSRDDVSVAGMVDEMALALAKHCLLHRLEEQKALREREERQRQCKKLERRIRQLQEDGADRATLEPLVRQLLALQEEQPEQEQ